MYSKRVDYKVDVLGYEKVYSFTIEQMKADDYLVEFYGDRRVKPGFAYCENHYSSLEDFLGDLLIDNIDISLIFCPIDSTEVIGPLLVGDDSLELDFADKQAVLERFAKPGRFALHENGYVSENIEISVGTIKEEDGYLVGSVLVDGGRYPFDYCLETEQLEIHHYSEPSWIDGRSCVELNLPSVVQRNYVDVYEEISFAIYSFLEKKVDRVIEDATERSEASQGKVARAKGQGKESPEATI